MSASVQDLETAKLKNRRIFPMRLKLLVLFGGSFTIVFIFIAIWILNFTTGQASDRLESQLASSTQGAASTLNPELFSSLVNTVDEVKDPKNEYGYGYPKSPLYAEASGELLKINKMVPEALSYSYFKDATDGKLYFAASSGFLLKPQFGVPFRVPVAKIVNALTLSLMEKGLSETTAQPQYTDAYGTWISSYSPVFDANGQSVGAGGVDYPKTYVDKLDSQVKRKLYPILGISYIFLVGLIILISSQLVRPLRRLTEASARIAEGEYDLNVRSLISSVFPDEMYTLAESFSQMASKVDNREKTLTQEVKRLKVEIDQARRVDSVREITESESFNDLAQKAAEMRKRMRSED